jgi:capsular exopolysaccharide synthesis family protein
MEKICVNRNIAKEFLVSEAFKTLRTNLLFSGAGVRCVGLTSFSASEGKSSVSCQLAISMAQMGKRVVLLDTDMRKSVLHSRFGLMEPALGLSHFLSDMAKVDEIIHETDVDGLSMILSGPLVPNAAELLSGERFQELIGVLREQFDYIIVDTPPLGQVIDCAVIASLLDGVMLLIDTTRNSIRLEKRLLNQLTKSGGKVLGVILNKVDFEDRSGYYGKAYDGKYSYKA